MKIDTDALKKQVILHLPYLSAKWPGRHDNGSGESKTYLLQPRSGKARKNAGSVCQAV